MGMAGLAVVRCQDGAVFAHVHPMATICLAAQEFFASGKLVNHAATKWGQPAPELLLANAELHGSHTNQRGVLADIYFPYAFPQAGKYRIWVQTKSQGRILTGVFDANVTTK
jgi:hypothetical protein